MVKLYKIIEFRNRIISIRYIDYLGFLIILFAIGTNLYINFHGRSFWIDEALQAYSFSERNIWNLTSTPFEWDQAAPVLYLYLCKIITLFFGNSEFVLRSISIVSYIIILYIVYLLAKKVFLIKCPVLCSAYVANIPFIFRYTNEFHQYIFEVTVTLIIFYLYYFYKEHYISYKILLVLFPVFIWCANPACFFVGGILIYEIIYAISRKDRKLIYITFLIGFTVFLSFVFYYIYWLKSIASSYAMQNDWHGYAFSLFPKSSYDLKRSFVLIKELFLDYFQLIGCPVLITTCVSISYGICKKNTYITVISLSILVCLFASSFHKFPIFNRICLFLIPFIVLMSCSVFGKIIPDLYFALVMLTISINAGGLQGYYMKKYPAYHSQHEPNIAISYLIRNITNDEKLFVNRWAIPVVKYKIGYTTNIIGQGQNDNIIWGEHPPYNFKTQTDEKENRKQAIENIDKIVKSKNCYIITTHSLSSYFDFWYILESISNKGFLELVMDWDVNPLYFYTDIKKHIKQYAKYEIVNIKNNTFSCEATIKITNTGKAYINGTKYDNVVLSAKNNEDFRVKLDRKLAPNESIALPISFLWREGEHLLELQLKNEGKFWFEELGCSPLRIVRPQPAPQS